jgi:hypothetical protein
MVYPDTDFTKVMLNMKNIQREQADANNMAFEIMNQQALR